MKKSNKSDKVISLIPNHSDVKKLSEKLANPLTTLKLIIKAFNDIPGVEAELPGYNETDKDALLDIYIPCNSGYVLGYEVYDKVVIVAGFNSARCVDAGSPVSDLFKEWVKETFGQTAGYNAELSLQQIYDAVLKLMESYSKNLTTISVPATNENLSLPEQECELIKSALRKYKGKRKDAAQELGISERTLYRRCQEYDLLHFM